MDSLRPATGDVLFTRGNSWFNRISCWATGPAGHQATVYDASDIVEADKSNGGIVRSDLCRKLREMNANDVQWILFHWAMEIGEGRKAKMRADMREAMTFQEYSTLELPLQFLDALINKARGKPRQGWDAYIFRRMGNLWKNGVICSKTSNRVLIRNGLIPKESGLEYGSPSDTYRWLMRCDKCVVLSYSEKWFEYPGAKRDEIGRAALPGLIGRYPWRMSLR